MPQNFGCWMIPHNFPFAFGGGWCVCFSWQPEHAEAQVFFVFFFLLKRCTAWIWIWLKQITSNHLFVLCKAYVPENEKIICGLLEVLQFEKSYAGEDATFCLESWSEFFRSLCSPFKAGAKGFILHWSPGVVSSVNEVFVSCVIQDDQCVVLRVSDDFHFACFSSLRKRREDNAKQNLFWLWWDWPWSKADIWCVVAAITTCYFCRLLLSIFHIGSWKTLAVSAHDGFAQGKESALN